MANKKYDIVILGSGIASTILATILQNNNRKVLVIESSSHPRFAIGESTIPQSSKLLALLAKKYGVPELLNLTSPKLIQEKVSANCGVKKIFGFAYHELGEEYDPCHSIQFGSNWREDNHLYRSDVDYHLVRLAIQYGVDLWQNTKVVDINFNLADVTITTQSGDEISTEFVVDGTGYNSLLAKKFNLRETPPELCLNTRTLFTHMIDVEPFENCTENIMTNPWSKGTLHHLFKGGWFWVIPFNNQGQSVNNQISVGLTVDNDLYPDTGLDAEKEFFNFLEKLPSVKKQFSHAKAARPWVKTGRLQYTSSSSIGDRYALLPHSYSFVDPLFSRGLINSFELINVLADDLISQFKGERNFSKETLKRVDDYNKRLTSYHDKISVASYQSWNSFRVWNAWLRFWAVGIYTMESKLSGYLLLGSYSSSKPKDDFLFSPFEEDGFKEFFLQGANVVEEFYHHKLTELQAEEKLFALLDEFDFDIKLPIKYKHNTNWALTNPRCRDFFLGDKALISRWLECRDDPLLKSEREEFNV